MSKLGQYLKVEWDGVTALIVAFTVAVLAVLDAAVPDADMISDRVLGSTVVVVLALLSAAILKDRQAKAREQKSHAADNANMREELQQIRSHMQSTDEQLRLLNGMWPEPASEISDRLAEGWNETKRWNFKGGTGTYLRAKTLPGLHRSRREETDVWVEIIAPDDDRVTKRYAEHRRQLQERDPTRNGVERWTDTRAKIEACATVVAAVWYSRHTRLRVHVALSSTMSTTRYDRSDRFVVITNEDPEAHGFTIKAEGQFFGAIDQELRVSFKEARQLDISQAEIPRDFRADDVRRTLRMVGGLTIETDFLTDDTCHEIGLKAISKEHADELGVAHGGADNPYPPRRR